MFWRQKHKKLPHLKMINGLWKVTNSGDSPFYVSEASRWVAQKNAQIIQGKIFERQLNIRAAFGGYYATYRYPIGVF